MFHWTRIILKFRAKKTQKCHSNPVEKEQSSRYNPQFSWLVSRVRLFATPWIAARQASLSITIFRSSLKLMYIKSVMPSSHLILCRPLFLLPPTPPSIRVFSPTPPSIRVFSNESTLRMRWPRDCYYHPKNKKNQMIYKIIIFLDPVKKLRS